jgi:ribosome-associated protein
MNNLVNIEKPKEFIKRIVDSIHEKMGKEVVCIDLQKLDQSITDYFIICHGDNDKQVDAIAHNIIDNIKKESNLNPWHKEGFENSQWVLIDYANVLIHIFDRNYREFYNLEELWGDGEITKYEDN